MNKLQLEKCKNGKQNYYFFVLIFQSSILFELQKDLDTWLRYYNNERPHSGKYCYGKTPMQTFKDSKKLAFEKNNEILYLEHLSDNLIS